MPKLMIEIDLPEGQAIPSADDIARLTNPDWIASWWHIDDVTDCCDWQGFDLTDDDAREVLRLADKYHDSENGINWAVLQSWVDHIVKQKEKRAA
jgi:hypothetical protein